jgi:hypothetical protein
MLGRSGTAPLVLSPDSANCIHWNTVELNWKCYEVRVPHDDARNGERKRNLISSLFCSRAGIADIKINVKGI